MACVHEQLSAQFYEWEMRGRGWRVWPEPVVVEPPFRFLEYSLPQVADDGRRRSLLSSIALRLAGFPSEEPPPEPPAVEEPIPKPLVRAEVVEFQTILPANLDLPRDAFEPFLGNLCNVFEPISFELVGTPGRVCAQFAAHPTDAQQVRRQLIAYFPEAVFQAPDKSLADAWLVTESDEALVVEFGLAKEFVLPLASGRIDPFIGLIGALAELQPDEIGVFQVLFQAVSSPWGEGLASSLEGADGRPVFVNAPELSQAAQRKSSRPLYAAVVRIGVKTPDYDRSVLIARDLAASLSVFADPTGNELIPLANDDYPFEEHVIDLLQRQTRRSGMILTSDELIGFVHLPSSAVKSSVLVRQTTRSKAAPAMPASRGALLGHNAHLGRTIPVILTPEQRVRHVHVIGASGTGKSTLLFNLIRQDIENGDGVALLDPHGDMVDAVLGIIPTHRVEDVVLVDPSDESGSIPFNMLSGHSDQEKALLASDLVSVFQRLSTSWGDQMASVLNNAIMAMLESEQGGTLADLRRFLVEPDFRREFLKSVHDPEVLYYWTKGFVQLTGNKSIGPVLTRLERFLGRKPIRYMVSQPANRLDFASMLDTGKIFLAKLSEGVFGKENSYLLGSLFVSKFREAAMARQTQAAGSRRDFWLYIDEFHNFITPSMEEILSGARKYRVGLVLAHQDLRQLQRDANVASAVLSNCGTRICFRLGDDDARKLADGFSYFEARDLQNLGTGEAIGRIERADQDFNLKVPLPALPNEAEQAERRQAATEASRRRYATPRREIERILHDRLGLTERVRVEAFPEQQRPALSEAPPAPAAPSAPTPEPTSPRTPASSAPERVPTVEQRVDKRQHEAIKEQIARKAETLDYTVTFEEFVAGTQGRADLVLRRGTRVIACEITVTTTVEHEVQNVAKCLGGTYTHVAVVSIDRKKLTAIKEAVGAKIAADQLGRVGFYTPAELEERLFAWAQEDPAGGQTERGKGGKRMISLGATELTPAERAAREATMRQQLAAAMKRGKRKQ